MLEKMKTKKEQETGKLMFQKDKNGPRALLTDFEIITMIGKGSIANVFLIKKKDTGEPFAMKSISKDTIVSENLIESTRLE